VQSMHIQQVKLEADEQGMGDHSDLLMCQKNFAAGETAKTEPATGVARCSDQRDQKADVEVSRNYQQGEVEQKEGSSSSSSRRSSNNRMERMNSSRG
jgi:hypothetical protein